jgi:hypothetical protein
MIRAGTHHDLPQVKQEMKETLRWYTRCFFEMHATIVNITDEDVIRCFQNGLFSKHTYHYFGRNCPTTAVDLRDMMAWWADQEDKENDRFPKRNNDKQGNCNNHFDKGQRNHSGNPWRRNPDQEVMAIERNPRGKRSGNNDAQFEKVLHKQYPMHLKSQHTLFECSASASHSMLYPFCKLESERTRRMKRVTSRGLKISRTQRTSSTSSLVETEVFPPSARRS